MGELLNSKSTFLDRERPEVKSNKIHRQWLMATGSERLLGHHSSHIIILIHSMQQSPTRPSTVPLPNPSIIPSRHTVYRQPNLLAVPWRHCFSYNPLKAWLFFLPHLKWFFSLSTTPFLFLLSQSLKLLSCVYSKLSHPLFLHYTHLEKTNLG